MNRLYKDIDNWVEQYPFLKKVANLQKKITSIIENYNNQNYKTIDHNSNWEEIVEGLKRGIPALKASEVDSAIVNNAASLLKKIVEALTDESLPVEVRNQCQNIINLFKEKASTPERIVKQVLETNTVNLKQSGMTEANHIFIIFLAWSALSCVLKGMKTEVRKFQQENKWAREYCPVCGQLPVMGHLVKTRRGRERELVCGCCQMKWNYKRLGCPYCRNEDQKTLKIIDPVEIPNLRIDTCEKCKSYIKIYTGEGNEEVALADWTTIHLDVIGKNSGFRRVGYQLWGV